MNVFCISFILSRLLLTYCMLLFRSTPLLLSLFEAYVREPEKHMNYFNGSLDDRGGGFLSSARPHKSSEEYQPDDHTVLIPMKIQSPYDSNKNTRICCMHNLCLCLSIFPFDIFSSKNSISENLMSNGGDIGDVDHKTELLSDNDSS